jgi:hypothetical protein
MSKSETIEIVVRWEGIIPLLVEVAANGATLEVRKEAMGELRRLARIVDERNAAIRASKEMSEGINTLIANMRHAARNRQSAEIGGGDFSYKVLAAAADLLDAA